MPWHFHERKYCCPSNWVAGDGTEEIERFEHLKGKDMGAAWRNRGWK
jgi:hypothetical protein